MAVADRGQRLHTEEETIEKPMRRGRARHAVGSEAVEKGEEKIQRHVNHRDKQRELRPTQAE